MSALSGPGRQLYFAYGSNLWPPRLADRLGSPVLEAGAAVLKGYKLEFCKRGRDGTGKATVVLTSNMQYEVPGGLYEVTQRELEALDQHEPDYQRLEVRVAVNGEVGGRTALTYVATPGSRDPDLEPLPDYLLLVIRGAIHWGLPESHLRWLGRRAARYSSHC